MTFTEALGIMAAYGDNRRRELQKLATMGSCIANFSGMGEKLVKPSDLIPDAFRNAGTPSREWLEKQYERHETRLKREQAKHSENGNNRGTKSPDNGRHEGA